MSKQLPKDWSIGIILLHNKGAWKDCSNYRRITILSKYYKIKHLNIQGQKVEQVKIFKLYMGTYIDYTEGIDGRTANVGKI